MPSQHAKLSPSAAKRWLTCPGSVALAAEVPSTSSQASDEGTAGHTLFEKSLRLGKKPAFWLGEKFNGIKVTKQMVAWVTEAVEWVTEYMENNPGSVIYSEEKVNIGPALRIGEDACWGTCDLFIMAPKELVVFDLKLGFIDVQPVNNPQLNLYAIGFLAEVGMLFDKVRLVIHQPRSGGAKETVLDIDEMLAIKKDYAPKAKLALQADAPLVPDEEACRWCPAAGTCPKLQEENLALARREFGPDTIDLLTEEQLLQILEKADIIEQALAAARAHAMRLITLGRGLPGWKVVTGRTLDAWKDKDEAAARLAKAGVSPYEQKLRTPPDVRDEVAQHLWQVAKDTGVKLTKKDAQAQAKALLAPLTYKPEGKPTLVRESDERQGHLPEFDEVP